MKIGQGRANTPEEGPQKRNKIMWERRLGEENLEVAVGHGRDKEADIGWIGVRSVGWAVSIATSPVGRRGDSPDIFDKVPVRQSLQIA